MKKLILFLAIITYTITFSQEERIPEGWDKVILEGEVAYMNLINGEISKSLPRTAARKPVKVKEFEPTIIHTVEKGDTFSNIARKYNMSLSELYKLNNLEDFDTVEIGQEVVVGYKNEGGINSSVQSVSYEDDSYYNNEVGNYDSNSNYHVVKAGETLYRISVNYNISVDELKKLNSLTSNTISIGQKIIIKK